MQPIALIFTNNFFTQIEIDLSRSIQILFYRKARKVFVSVWFVKKTKFAKLVQYKALRSLHLLKILLYKKLCVLCGKIN
ncbi:hypothetical protein C4F50_09395 [Flavobacterium sp. KB82]|uniref:Uncharacterized protein n=1 Tax=Flavobacterium hungaricum TaxID=2082725 RepID=A0ABR9TII0_9FLAO|nr:hypothetical protein [Flavobacterium hungaricum]